MRRSSIRRSRWRPTRPGWRNSNATIASLLLAPTPYPTAALPETAKAVSGIAYAFEDNPLDIESLSLEFDDSAQARLKLKMQGRDQTLRLADRPGWEIPAGGRGGRAARLLADPETFVMEIFDIGQVSYQIHFEGDGVVMEAPELGMRFEGRRVGE